LLLSGVNDTVESCRLSDVNDNAQLISINFPPFAEIFWLLINGRRETFRKIKIQEFGKSRGTVSSRLSKQVQSHSLFPVYTVMECLKITSIHTVSLTGERVGMRPN
jgi:hypothetical protein